MIYPLQSLAPKPLVVIEEPVAIEEVEVVVIAVPDLGIPKVRCSKELAKYLDSLEDIREEWCE